MPVDLAKMRRASAVDDLPSLVNQPVDWKAIFNQHGFAPCVAQIYASRGWHLQFLPSDVVGNMEMESCIPMNVFNAIFCELMSKRVSGGGVITILQRTVEESLAKFRQMADACVEIEIGQEVHEDDPSWLLMPGIVGIDRINIYQRMLHWALQMQRLYQESDNKVPWTDQKMALRRYIIENNLYDLVSLEHRSALNV